MLHYAFPATKKDGAAEVVLQFYLQISPELVMRRPEEKKGTTICMVVDQVVEAAAVVGAASVFVRALHGDGKNCVH